MPQELNVLCCYACKMYQVHIVKKSNKWQCKICDEKQSIQVVYFQGSGIDCRHQVQHLNSLKATKDEQQSFSSPKIDVYGLDCTADENDENDIVDRCQCPKRLKRSNGKWSQFLEPSCSSNDEDDVYHDTLSFKENFSTQENSKFLENPRKHKYSTKQSYSFPGDRNYASSSDFEVECLGTQACNSKSRSYPLMERSQKIFNKWDQYLESKKEELGTVFKNDFSSIATSSSSNKKLPGKWDKFLEQPKNGQGSNLEVEDGQDEEPTNNSTTCLYQSTKCNIFEDYNDDDLDLTIDF